MCLLLAASTDGFAIRAILAFSIGRWVRSWCWEITSPSLPMHWCCGSSSRIVCYVSTPSQFALKLTKPADEERYLITFFGDDYREYRNRTPTLIPFVG